MFLFCFGIRRRKLLLRFRQLSLEKGVLVSKRKATENVSEETENPIKDFADNAEHLNSPGNAERLR